MDEEMKIGFWGLMAETNEKDTTESEIFIARVFCLIASTLC